MAKALSHSFLTYVSYLLATVSTFFNNASSAAIRLPHSNVTISSVANGNQCTDKPAWIGTGSSSLDCIGAVQKLYDSEVKPFSDIDFEFLSEKAPARSLPSMRTPRKYTVGKSFPKYFNPPSPSYVSMRAELSKGSCTLAIVMLNFFSDGELPGGVEGPFASRDVTSFYEIWQAAQKIEATCLMQYGRPGWAAEGGREAVGVFLWATNSFENQRVPQGELPSVGAYELSGFSFNMSGSTSITGEKNLQD